MASGPITSSQISSVQWLSHVWLFATPWTSAHQASLCITNTWNLLKLMSTELAMPSNHFILCRPLLLPPSVFPSIRVFSNCITQVKYWSFSINISPSNEHSGLTFRMDWLDLLAVQGTLKSLLQHHSSTASFFSAQLLIYALVVTSLILGLIMCKSLYSFRDVYLKWIHDSPGGRDGDILMPILQVGKWRFREVRLFA